MKRPEYVAIVTGVYSRALKEGREPTAEELQQLEQVFSRQGFSDGYYLGKKGAHMFGVRPENENVPKELYAQARATYENGENRKEPVKFYALIEKGQPAQIAVQDKEGHVAHAEGPVPEEARVADLTKEVLVSRLTKTGGTPYYCADVQVELTPGLTLSASAINGVRRDALNQLTALRARRDLPRLGKPGKIPVLPGNRHQPAIWRWARSRNSGNGPNAIFSDLLSVNLSASTIGARSWRSAGGGTVAFIEHHGGAADVQRPDLPVSRRFRLRETHTIDDHHALRIEVVEIAQLGVAAVQRRIAAPRINVSAFQEPVPAAGTEIVIRLDVIEFAGGDNRLIRIAGDLLGRLRGRRRGRLFIDIVALEGVTD